MSARGPKSAARAGLIGVAAGNGLAAGAAAVAWQRLARGPLPQV
jgi:hypothetical protein